MEKTLVCFTSYNRRGTAATNLKALLDNTKDDFDFFSNYTDSHKID